MEHAPIAISSLYRTVPCPGWIKMASTVEPLPPSEEELEGQAAHEVILKMQQGEVVNEGDETTVGVRVTEEMIDGGMLWIRSIMPLGVAEQPVRVSRIHPVHCWGTPDYYSYGQTTKTIYLPDYKFGHRFVEVFNNWQIVGYVAGVLEKLGLDDQETTVIGSIIQPRGYHPEGPVRMWKFTASDIRAHINIAMQAAQEALGPNPKTQAGNHCRDCPARHQCPTLQAAGADGITFTGSSEPSKLTGATLALELFLLKRAEKLMEARITGLEEQAKALLSKGLPLPGIYMQRTAGRLAWNPDVTIDELRMLGELCKLDIIKPPKAITPKQLVDLGIDEAVISEYATRSNGGFKLAFDPDNIRSQKAFGANRT